MSFKGFAPHGTAQTNVVYTRVIDTEQRVSGNVDHKSSGLNYDRTHTFVHPLNNRLELGFRDIEILPNDWDSYGSPAPTRETVALAKSICREFPTDMQPDINPEKDGSVGLYWDLEDESLWVKIRSDRQDNPEWGIDQTDATITPSQLSLPSVLQFFEQVIRENLR
jgi:hypothetical protein